MREVTSMELENQENMQVENEDNTAVVEKEENGEPTQTMFNQEQVNEFVRSRLDKYEKSLFKHYGVESRDGLNELFGKAQSYSVMAERLKAQRETNSQLLEENCFLKNKVNPEKYEDVRAYFKGKGLEFNEDNLKNELSTHNEWLIQVAPTTTIKSVGADQNINAPRIDEKEQASKLFGLSKLI